MTGSTCRPGKYVTVYHMKEVVFVLTQEVTHSTTSAPDIESKLTTPADWEAKWVTCQHGVLVWQQYKGTWYNFKKESEVVRFSAAMIH